MDKQMMKQAQEMQERLQQQMTELRVEATAGGGMVTVDRQRPQASAEDHDRSGSGVEGRRRDAAGPDRRRGQRRASQGRRGDEATDGRPARRPGHSRANCGCRCPRPCRNSSISSRSSPASARKTRSGWPFTCCGRRAKTPSGCATRSATSRIASPTARPATTSPTSIRA